MSDLNVMRMEVLKSGDNGLNIPVNMRRLIWNAQTKFDCGPTKPPPPGGLSPMDITNKVEELGKKLMVVVGQDELSKVSSVRRVRVATCVMDALIGCVHVEQMLVTYWEFICIRTQVRSFDYLLYWWLIRCQNHLCL